MQSSELLTDDVAVVTGGGSGIGRGIARSLAEQGAHVVVADLNSTPREGGQPTHQLIQTESSADAEFVECDVRNLSDIENAIDVADRFGGVTIMVNNAGITESKDFLEISESEYDNLMAVNVKGVFFGAQAAARSMVDGDRRGNIINISSTSGLRGRGDGVTYCTSKGGVRLMTYAQADALAPRIRVNAIHPDVTETEMTRTDLGIVGSDEGRRYLEENMLTDRFARPGDIGDAAVYLASDLSQMVTGHSLVVDGGITATK